MLPLCRECQECTWRSARRVRMIVSAKGLEQHHLQRRGSDPAIALRQEALACVHSQNRTPWRAQVDRRSNARDRLPAGIERAVASPGLLEKQIEPVLIEDVERIRSARLGQLFEARAGCRHAVNPRVVEHPELVLRKAIEIASA